MGLPVASITDVASDASCGGEGLSCVMRAFTDHLLANALVFGVCLVLGLVFAMWFAALAGTRVEGRDPRVPRGRRRLLSQPIRADGGWMRLVEDERGHRVVEMLDGADWRASTRDLPPLTLDVPAPVRPRS
jgi:hypothetical protein